MSLLSLLFPKKKNKYLYSFSNIYIYIHTLNALLRIKYKINQNVYFFSQVQKIYLFIFFEIIKIEDSLSFIFSKLFRFRTVMVVIVLLLTTQPPPPPFYCHQSPFSLRILSVNQKLESSIFNQNDGKQIIFSQNHFAFLFWMFYLLPELFPSFQTLSNKGVAIN